MPILGLCLYYHQPPLSFCVRIFIKVSADASSEGWFYSHVPSVPKVLLRGGWSRENSWGGAVDGIFFFPWGSTEQSGKDHSGIHEGFEWFAKANEDSARGWWDESPRGGKGLGRIWFNSVEMRRTQDRQSCLWILVSCFSVLPSISTFKIWTMLTVLTMLVYISVYRKALFIQKQLLPD